jgi:nucleosome assembly protein 1-like 1
VQEDSEGEEEMPTISSAGARGDIRSQLAGNPLLASMVQGKLAGLIGKSSGYIDSLPAIVKQRVDGLKGLQIEHTKLEAEFQKEILELEKRFAEKYRPIYERRRAIIEGKEEPTEEEIKTGYKVDLDEDSDEEDEDEEAAPKEREIVSAEEAAKGPKGIPGFWLTALSNHAGISELITERDEEALKHLVDVRVEYLGAGKPGFKLLFEFDDGASSFFENKILEKTYYYQEEVGSLGDFVYDRAEGSDIKWKTGKDLTVRVETKKQRNKNTNQTRTVKKVVPTESFFNFFKPPTPPEDDASDIDEDIDEKLELDYQIGEDIKDRIVPHAIDYFTGKALQQELEDEDFQSEFDDEDDFEDDDDEDDEDDDDDDQVAGGRAIKGARKAAQPPQSGVTPGSAQDPAECKNQ